MAVTSAGGAYFDPTKLPATPTVASTAASTAPVAPVAPKLAPPTNWGQYIGDGTEIGGARDTTFTDQNGWDQSLAYVRQFDPDASIQGTIMPDGSGGQYIKFNNSLMPKNPTGQNGILGMSNVGALKDNNLYMGPQAKDPVWGTIGSSNPRLWRNNTTWLDTAGPLIMAAITGGASFLNPGFMGSLAQAIPTAARGAANGGFNPLQLLPFLSKVPGLIGG